MELWGPIDLKTWRSTPCMRGTLATEADVRAGRAVFHLGSDSADVARVGAQPLPCLGIQKLDGGRELPVVVVQVEEVPGKSFVGVRYVTGGNGVCFLSELELVDESDQRLSRRSPPPG